MGIERDAAYDEKCGLFVLKARVKTDKGGALNKPTSTRRMGRQGGDVVMLKMKPGKELATVRRKEEGR